MHHGSCLCDAVSFTVDGELNQPDACHCSQCRRQSGHFWASTDVPRERLTITGDDNLTWFHATDRVRRGFCRYCGSFLFWEPIGGARVAVAMGAFDPPTDTRLHMHIFVADKGDYYDLDDGVPQNAQ
jgi:hypothetical protein